MNRGIKMNTETLDKLYLEWSQFTKAKTEREIELTNALSMIQKKANEAWDRDTALFINQVVNHAFRRI